MDQRITARPRGTSALLACGAIAAPLFLAIVLVEGALRPDYQATRHVASALSLGDRGWIQIGNFVLTGLLMCAFAVGLRRALAGGRGGRWAPILIGTYGLGLIASGFFVTDPVSGYPPGAAGDSWHGTLHDLAAIVVFGALPLGCLVLARRFAGRRGERRWAVYSVLTALAVPALLAGITVDGQAGLFQRATIAVGWAWVALVALHVRAELRSARRPVGLRAEQPTER
nr:DUF998 domain-containing protein [Micromonospora sp. DSM 115978]